MYSYERVYTEKEIGIIVYPQSAYLTLCGPCIITERSIHKMNLNFKMICYLSKVACKLPNETVLAGCFKLSSSNLVLPLK